MLLIVARLTSNFLSERSSRLGTENFFFTKKGSKFQEDQEVYHPQAFRRVPRQEGGKTKAFRRVPRQEGGKTLLTDSFAFGTRPNTCAMLVSLSNFQYFEI